MLVAAKSLIGTPVGVVALIFLTFDINNSADFGHILSKFSKLPQEMVSIFLSFRFIRQDSVNYHIFKAGIKELYR